MITAIRSRTGATALCWLLASATGAAAEGAWVLWARPCDIRSQVCGGKWERRQTYEAERWCRAARTTAINRGLSPEGSKAAYARGTVVEYQCLPETVAPQSPTSTK